VFERRIDFHSFSKVSKKVLIGKRENELIKMFDYPKIKNLFLCKVDHPMGYGDGVSETNVRKMCEMTGKLTEKDRKNIFEVSEKLLEKIEKSNIRPQEKSNLILGINQLLQNISWNQYIVKDEWHEFRTKSNKIVEKKVWNKEKIQELVNRIVEIYTKNKTIKRIKEWDQQILENQSFHHIEKGMDLTKYGYSMVNAIVVSTPLIFINKSIAITVVLAHATTTVISMMFTGGMNAIMLELQEFTKNKNDSPNLSKKLVTNRHYKFLRHPLYATRIIGDLIDSVLFPIGTYGAIKTLYHNIKGCEKQDERMRVLHGETAIEYQEKTPMVIPGSKLIIKILKKIVPEKIISKLETPISKYLEKIFKNESKYELVESKPLTYYNKKPPIRIEKRDYRYYSKYKK
jgi:protein-S-isoprenylcysteine O-methyltransferase Ste14